MGSSQGLTKLSSHWGIQELWTDWWSQFTQLAEHLLVPAFYEPIPGPMSSILK